MCCLENSLPHGKHYFCMLNTREKVSGVNMIKPYSDLIIKPLFNNRVGSKGAFFRTTELFINYLSALEELDHKSPNHDLQISFTIELDKIEILPLFGKHELQNKPGHSRNYSFISLTLKILMQLFFDLSERLYLSTDPEPYKSIITNERQYIESIFNLTKSLLLRKNFSKLQDYRAFQLVYETLLFHFSEFHKKFVSDTRFRAIISKIETRNNELKILFITLEGHTSKSI